MKLANLSIPSLFLLFFLLILLIAICTSDSLDLVESDQKLQIRETKGVSIQINTHIENALFYAKHHRKKDAIQELEKALARYGFLGQKLEKTIEILKEPPKSDPSN